MRKLYMVLILLACCVISTAQPSEVTLVVFGEGATKEEATNNALRSAIEQAFGVFVSAKTDILNDDIIKDEIATLTSGNIKSFEELSFTDLSNGIKSISLKATVAIGSLIEYSKSHGSQAEFAGSLFGANLKMHQLNKINEEMVIEHLLSSIEPDSLLDIQLDLPSQPFVGKVIFYNQGLKSDGRSEHAVEAERNIKYPISYIAVDGQEEMEQYYVKMLFSYCLTDYGFSILKNLANVLSSISLSSSEKKEYQSSNWQFYKIKIGKNIYYLRSLRSALSLYNLSKIIHDAMFGYWNLVIHTSNSERFYFFGAPYYYSHTNSYADALSLFIPVEYEFFLSTGLMVDYDNNMIVEKDLDNQLMYQRLVKEIMRHKYGIDEWIPTQSRGINPVWKILENHPLFHFNTVAPDSKESGTKPFKIVLAPSNYLEAPLLLTYFVGKSPFRLNYAEKSTYKVHSEFGGTYDEWETVPTFSYDSFIFDCLEDHLKNKPSLPLETIQIMLSFPEKELQEITAIQIEKRF